MAFMLQPAEILNNLVCDSCYRFLSVTPVKIYPNGQTKCGRCISENDNVGVLSKYNDVATKIIFKCVNRLDGCEILLTSSETITHEAICKPKSYKCPLCNEDIFTYLLAQHFKMNHPLSMLTTPFFTILQLKEMNEFFLYNVPDKLLFINFICERSIRNVNYVKISLNCLYVGNYFTANTISVKFAIGNGKILIERSTGCDTFPSAGTNNVVSGEMEESSLINVMFSIHLEKTDVYVPLKSTLSNWANWTTNEERLIKLYFKERDTYLSDTFKTYVPSAKALKGSRMRLSNPEGVVSVILTCFNCSMSVCAMYSTGIYGIYRNNVFKYICFYCGKIIKRIEKNIFSLQAVGEIHYYCKWECGIYKKFKELLDHEKNCPEQFSQECPVEKCKCYIKLFEIREHFEEYHSNLIEPIFTLNGIFDMQLKPNESPLIKFVVVSHICINVTFTWISPFWDISLSCNLPGVRLRCIITNFHYSLVSFIQTTGRIYDEPHIRLKCYLGDPNNQNGDFDYTDEFKMLEHIS